MSGSNLHTLELRLGDRLIGHLDYDSQEQFTLSYDETWQREGFPLAPLLKLDGSATHTHIKTFLENLLPENRGLEQLIEALSVSRTNIFALIRGIGRDTSGAISFTLPGEAEPATLFRPIQQEELLLRLDNPEIWPLEVWDKRPRLSVAGVQSKLNLLYREGELGLGDGALCSTHILKFENHRHSHLVINEFVTMQLAAALKLDVAHVELMTIGQHRGLLVKRFDRRFDSEANRVRRRHMIDACQALGFSVSKKYERNFGDGPDVAHIREGVSLVRLFGLCEQCINPAQTKLNMLQWVLFNLCVSNHDAHGKNYSFFVSRDGLSPTPWYDLVNISLYPQFSQTLAMGISDEFEPDGINAYQLLEFAEECGIARRLLQQTLNAIASGILAQIDAVISRVPTRDSEESAYLARYREQVLARCQHELEQAVLRPELRL